MKKIHALYIRVSTEAQAEEGYSIAAQTQRLEAYSVAMGWENTQLFIDGGYSGSHLDRPAIMELMTKVQEEGVASVVVYKLDRLSRSQKDTLYLIEDVFLPYQVDFISLNESIDTSTPYGRAMIGILSAFAQLERENIYLRTRMGMLERVKQGYWMGGGTTPFGYRYDKSQGILVPHLEEAQIVEQVYHLYIQGNSPQTIAQRLGLSYERLVTQIISRRSNLGFISYKGKEYVGKHQAIISQELFDKAQEKRKSREISRRSCGVHLLSGVIYCKQCSSRMRYVKWGKNGYKLRCYSQDPSKQYMSSGVHCTAAAVWANEVEQIVVEDMKRISLDLRDKTPCISYPEREKQQTLVEKKLKRLYHLYAQGENDVLLSAISECKEQLAQLQQEILDKKAKEEHLSYLQELQKRICTLGESWDFLENGQKQEIIRDCVNKIEICDKTVDIYYQFITKPK